MVLSSHTWQRRDYTGEWELVGKARALNYTHATKLADDVLKAAEDNFLSKNSSFYKPEDESWDVAWWKGAKGHVNNQMENMRMFYRLIRGYLFTNEDKHDMSADPCLMDEDYKEPNCDHVVECWFVKRFFMKTVLTTSECCQFAYHWSKSVTNVRQVGKKQNWESRLREEQTLEGLSVPCFFLAIFCKKRSTTPYMKKKKPLSRGCYLTNNF